MPDIQPNTQNFQSNNNPAFTQPGVPSPQPINPQPPSIVTNGNNNASKSKNKVILSLLLLFFYVYC
ncbi:hypothetical protein HC864_02750 [Candidatus Gracilibacteria bacterium]|nr:hypothetical protein [Candidatus Gracilibacteria bacterium]